MLIAAVVGNCVQFQVCRDLAASPGDLSGYVRALWQAAKPVLMQLIMGALICVPVLLLLLGVSVSAVACLYCAIVCMLLSAIANGFSAGYRRLKFQGVSNAVGAALKLISGWFLFAFSLGVPGGLIAYALGFIVVVVWTLFYLTRTLPRDGADSAIPGVNLRSLGWVMLAYSLLILPFGLDQIMVQALRREYSGIYAAMATYGKLVFYAASPVLAVMYPYVVGTDGDPRRQTRYFRAGTGIALFLALLCTGLLWILGPLGVQLVLSPRYLLVTPIVPAYLLAMTCYVGAYGLGMFAIARRSNGAVIGAFVCVAVQVGLFYFSRASVAALALNQLITCAILLVVLWIDYRRCQANVAAK